tara:strand:+ start:38 stop:487 length:450 start_codon:yes stop_codon:yes gene_type:complete
MHIALYKPDIPQNTAAIVRLCACLNLKIHIIEPCGFDLHDKRFKRVVMDYSEFCKIYKYEDYDKFLNKNKKKRIVLMTTKAKKNYHRFIFKKNDILLFGRESAGVPDSLHKTIKDKVKVPLNKRTRSLNVAMSVAIISAEALRQINLLK